MGKFWQVFFWVVNLSREFFGYSKQSEDSCSSRVSRPLTFSRNFRARKFGMGFLGGYILVQEYFGVSFEALEICLADFCP